MDDIKPDDSPVEAALSTIAIPDERWQLPAMARGLIRGYDARWRESHRKIAVEKIEPTYESKLFNPETGRTSRTFSVAGKLDKVARQNGRVLFDHKTTSMPIADLSGNYWKQLTVDAQAKHYELLLFANGIKVDRVVWDVVKKADIKPKNIAKKIFAETISIGNYCGFDLTQGAIDEIQRTQFENAELYEHRVAYECIENPDRYFQRHGVARLREELAEYANELWDMATEIREARANNRWYRNPGSCLQYNTPCKYLGICSGHDNEDSDNWSRRDNVHRELDLDSDGRNVLTHSRLRCFQTCHRKHFYQYELGLSRVDEEEREALWFGSLFHAALDVWWSLASAGSLT